MATHFKSPRLQAGLTMIELLAVLAISSLIVAALAAAWRTQGESRREDSAAEHAKTVIAAVQEYTRNNYSTIVAAAGPSTPYTVSAATLQASTAWPTGMSTNNAFSQSFVVRIIEPSTNRLEALILYTGGETLTTGTLRSVASKIGLAGGYVSAEQPATAYGMMRAWSKNLAAFGGNVGTGKVAASVFAADAMAIDDYLHRSATPGKPELNRMSTSIDMATNDLQNGGLVSAREVDASNGIRAAQLAVGKAAFGANPYDYESIQSNTFNNVRINIGTREHSIFSRDGTLTAHGTIVAESNMQANGNLSVGAEANVGGNLAVGGAVNAQGSMAASDVTVRNWFRTQGNGGWFSEPYGGGFYMSDAEWIRAYNNKSIYTGGAVRAGSLTSDGRATVGEFLQLNRQADEGGGCSPNGLVARAFSGKVLWCENGIWRSGGGVTDVQVIAGGYSQGPVWAYATCPAGYTASGGGYNVISMEKASSQEAPQVNRPINGTTWGIYSGGSSGAIESRFQVFAVCIR